MPTNLDCVDYEDGIIIDELIGAGPVTVHDVRYDLRTSNRRHDEEMRELWDAYKILLARIESLEEINTPGK